MVSGIRCVLTYLILPFATPLIGLAPGVGPVVGLVVGTVAIAANALSIRRFWRADHRWKKPVTALHGGVIVLLVILLYLDVTQLVS
jgi:multisubunit Na+/H+ antiporter MnhB subunit